MREFGYKEMLSAALLLACALFSCFLFFQVPLPALAGEKIGEAAAQPPSPASHASKPLVAIIDTGCDPSLCVDAVSVIDGDPANVDGHGTSVAQMVLGQDPDARILSIRALDDEDGASAEDVCAALRYAIDHGADIINMSFSSYMPDGCPEIEKLVAEATEARIAVVCSAGNKGSDASGYCPAQIEAAITVGCLGLNGEPSSSSNYGEEVDVWLVSASTSYSTAMASGRLSLMGRPADGDWLSELIAYGDIDVQDTVPVLDEDGEEIAEGENGFNPDFTHAALTSRVHISYIGDSKWMTTNESYPTATANTSMTSNSYGVHPQSNRWSHIENMAFKVTQNNAASGGITYRCYYRNTGYDSWRSNGAYSPASTGNGMSVEGLDAKLTGTLASCYNLNYKVYTSAQYEYDQTIAIPSSDSAKYPYIHKWYSASNGGYAGTQGKGVGIEGYRMWLTPKSYTHTVQIRYQNPNGSWGGWSNARSGAYAYGSTVPAWSRGEDATYYAGSMGAYTAGYANTTKQVSISRKPYYLDVNGYLDGANNGGVGAFGTFDFNVNGGNVANDVSDYYATSLAGSTWSITDVKAKSGYTYDGIREGATSGTLGTANAQAARLAFHTNTYTVAYDGNGATGGSTASVSHKCHEAKALSANGYQKTGYHFTGWNTKSNGTGTAYSPGQSATNLTLSDKATVTLYALWAPNSYTIAFDSNDGSGQAMEQDAVYDTAITAPETQQTVDGMVFAGWCTEADGSGTIYAPGEPISNLTTTQGATAVLYARWIMSAVPTGFETGGNTATAALSALIAMVAILSLLRIRALKRIRRTRQAIKRFE